MCNLLLTVSAAALKNGDIRDLTVDLVQENVIFLLLYETFFCCSMIFCFCLLYVFLLLCENTCKMYTKCLVRFSWNIWIKPILFYFNITTLTSKLFVIFECRAYVRWIPISLFPPFLKPMFLCFRHFQLLRLFCAIWQPGSWWVMLCRQILSFDRCHSEMAMCLDVDSGITFPPEMVSSLLWWKCA